MTKHGRACNMLKEECFMMSLKPFAPFVLQFLLLNPCSLIS